MSPNSSRWAHAKLPAVGSFAWQKGYAAFTVSPSQAEAARCYIQNQAVHHQLRTFEGELRALLDAHSVDYDERYLLG